LLGKLKLQPNQNTIQELNHVAIYITDVSEAGVLISDIKAASPHLSSRSFAGLATNQELQSKKISPIFAPPFSQA